MNDAYTVGLTLALEDGVSAGIETIRRELGALDQAIVVSTANLVRLQQVARGAVNAGIAQAGAMAALTRDAAAAAARQTGLPPRTPVVTMPEAASAGPAARTGPQDAPIVAAPPASMPATAQDCGEAAPGAPFVRADAAPSPQAPKPSSAAVTGAPIQAGAGIAQATAPVTVGPAAAFEQPPQPRPPAVEAPVSMVPSQAIRPPSAPPAPTLGAPTVIEAAAPPPAPPPAIATVAMPMALPVAPDKRQADQAAAPAARIEIAAPASFEAPRQLDMRPAPSMAPPPRGSPMLPITEAPRRPLHREHVASVAPRQATDRHREQAMSGTIMIDGTELGRWMTDYLGHAASRPPGGGVGFDPRMTPVWAGAPVGA